ncbi:MAG: dihydroorotate dehydrogenase electron transfer subunit [Clostridia bacterium]
MTDAIFSVIDNVCVANRTYRLRLEGDARAMTAPGQFVMVSLPGFFLRRPLSVCDWDDAGLTLVYKVLGAGTDKLAQLRAGESLTVLTGLGNGFDLTDPGLRPLIVGGGLGVAPMLALAKRLSRPTCVLGFQGAGDCFLVEELTRAGARVIVSTVDGSLGVKGFVTDVLKTLTPAAPTSPASPAALCPPFDRAYVCGPEPMLRAVHALYPAGQYSFEARMGCGFGACMGCSRKTKSGFVRICKEGPVLPGEEILW